jgi:hypothetical protein
MNCENVKEIEDEKKEIEDEKKPTLDTRFIPWYQ